MELHNLYEQEAKERWGNTDAYKQSQEKVKNMSKEDWERIGKENDDLLKELVANMQESPSSPKIQSLIGRHYNNLRNFYEPNLEMYRGLAEMYVSDARFGEFFAKYHKNLAPFMREAMLEYCKANER